MISYFRNLRVGIHDLVILAAIGFAIPCLLERVFISTIIDKYETSIPFSLYIVFFALCMFSIGIYFFLERKNVKSILLPVPTICLAILIVLFTITIYIQQDNVTNAVYIQSEWAGEIGKLINVTTTISTQMRFVYFSNVIIVFLAIYTFLFILPKKIGSLKFIHIMYFLFLIFNMVGILVGLITQFDSYIKVVKCALGIIKDPHFEELAPTSFFTHRNLFGLSLFFCSIFSILISEIRKKKEYIIISFITTFFLLFTICKTAILLIGIAYIMLCIYKMIFSIKNMDKNKIIVFSTISSLFILLLLVFLILYLLNDDFRNTINTILRGGDTVKTRTMIWDNVFLILKPAWWICGRGYWSFDTMLLSCNIATQTLNSGSTHNSFIALLGRGGLPVLIAYLYIMYLGIKATLNIKKNNNGICFVLLGSLLLLIVYSLLEDVSYVVLYWIFSL